MMAQENIIHNKIHCLVLLPQISLNQVREEINRRRADGERIQGMPTSHTLKALWKKVNKIKKRTVFVKSFVLLFFCIKQPLAQTLPMFAVK